MKVVILAGGLGTRISEESAFKPKPMIEIGGKPILIHIMESYSKQGFNEFVICAGYKQHVIKDYFAHYFLNNSDITFDFTGETEFKTIHLSHVNKWKVTVCDTGKTTLTGGRLAKVRDYINNERFMLTYGDGVSDVNFKRLIDFHDKEVKNGNIATLTACNVGQQFGVLDISDDEITQSVHSFREKSNSDGGWVNAGFMVLEPEIWEFLDETAMLEDGLLSTLSEKRLLSAYKHHGFWKAMDSMRDKTILDEMVNSGDVLW